MAHSGQGGPPCFIRCVLRFRSKDKEHRIGVINEYMAGPGACSNRFGIEELVLRLAEYPEVLLLETGPHAAHY
jgi:hypothetical protein